MDVIYKSGFISVFSLFVNEIKISFLQYVSSSLYISSTV